MAHVETEKHGDVAVVFLNNPPVNALGIELRRGLVEALDAAVADTTVVAIVLASRLSAFSGGADIKEFGQPMMSPTLRDVIDALDRSAKPIVAAIEGVALGGGLELALACDARVVTAGAKLGLPETNLGLLPGAGGTQRLPRLVGAAEALAIMADARPRPGKQAVAIGMADTLTEAPGLLDAAMSHARGLAVDNNRRRLRDKAVSAEGREAFDKAAADLLKARGDEPQIEALVDAVLAAFDPDFDQGMRQERSHFERLLVDDRSRALRNVFFAERGASRLPDGIEAGSARPVRSVGIVGGGTMGSGIAMAFAAAGIAVVLKETDADLAAKAVGRIGENFARSVEKGKLTAIARDQIMARIRPAGTYDAFAEVDLVVEAAFEEMEVKQTIFRDLDAATRPDAVLATNTSYLDVDAVARVCRDPSRVLGMHFFSPANVMKLVEVVRGEKTSGETLATVVAVAKQIGKLPVVVGNCHGFVGNRMLARRSEQVDRLLLGGALPEQVDAALTGFGFKLGPCAMGDLAGLDISWRMRRATGRSAPVADALVEAGRLGQKSGSGYYAYGEDRRTPISDPKVRTLIEGVSAAHGVTRRALDDEEVLDRMLLPMVNEGARILDEGIAARPDDIDVIWIHGYGFPRHRGGPMFYARQRGYANVVARLEELAEKTGEASLKPASYLVKLAEKEGAAR